MKGFNRTLGWFTTAVLMVTLSAVPALADLKKKDPKMTPATDKNTAVPAVPRAIPQLTPYWAFDPPANSLFDASKLTFSGDLRVRPEFRTNSTFGASKRNDFYVQQWMRLGINYSLSPDVEVFIQPQYAKNWGAASIAGAGLQNASGTCAANICANDSFNTGQGNSFFVRQAFVLIRNTGVQNLSIKLGRQLIVMGNHRLFGHFDWANTGFSQDAATFQYASKIVNLTGGWGRPSDKDFATFGANSTVFGVQPPGVGGPQTPASTDASNDADFFFARAQFKPISGLVIEPLWVLFINGAPSSVGAASTTAAHAANQNRHTVGTRIAFKKSIFDMNAEGYWQFGSMGSINSVNGPGNASRDLRINAYAGALQAGVTLPVPMQPRIGGEINIASGDGDATACANGATSGTSNGAGCNGTANTFEQLYPTNHILFGYMDLFAWRNMVSYGGNFQMRPTKNSHFEIWGNVFRRQSTGDNWYRAAQNVYFANTAATTSASLGQEIDVVYTMFFKDNKVGWQIGYGHFFPGQFVEQATGQNNPAGQDWGYTQVHVNF